MKYRLKLFALYVNIRHRKSTHSIVDAPRVEMSLRTPPHLWLDR